MKHIFTLNGGVEGNWGIVIGIHLFLNGLQRCTLLHPVTSGPVLLACMEVILLAAINTPGIQYLVCTFAPIDVVLYQRALVIICHEDLCSTAWHCPSTYTFYGRLEPINITWCTHSFLLFFKKRKREKGVHSPVLCSLDASFLFFFYKRRRKKREHRAHFSLFPFFNKKG